MTGSRKFYWLIFLGIIPDQNDKNMWVKQLQSLRQKYYEKVEAALFFKNLMEEQDAKMAEEGDDQNEIFQDSDKNIRNLIKSDISELAAEESKNELENILYLWSRDNANIGYRSGMHKILWIVSAAFFAETVEFSDDPLIEVIFG